MIINRILPGFIYGFFFLVCAQLENIVFINLLLTFFLIQLNIEFYNITVFEKNIFYKYILPIIYFIIPIIIIKNIRTGYGSEYLVFLLLMTWINDISAFFIGKKIGKNKLSNISPNKTVEGLLGSIFICILVCGKLSVFFNLNININSLLLGFIISISCNAGDLLESKIKRKYNVKESGKIMKGHGGILDRLDSILIASTIYYLILIYF